MFLQNANIQTRIIEDSTKIKDVTWQSINNIITLIVERLPYVLAGFLVLLLFWFLAKIVKGVFWSASGRTKLDNRLRILFSRLIVVFTVIIGLFTALTVIIPGFTFGSLVTGLGFTTFVIGFATKIF